MKRGFSEQELAEMRAFDEMIDCLDVVEADWASRWIDDLERLAEYQRAYRAANKERIPEYQRQYYAERKRRKQDENYRRT